MGRLVEEADFVGTGTITRVEMAAELAKAVRVGVFSREEAVLVATFDRHLWDAARRQGTRVAKNSDSSSITHPISILWARSGSVSV